MSKNAATEGLLGELHAAVAKVMKKALDTYDVAQKRYLEAEPSEDVSPPPEVPASLLGVITKFLSDNKITCAPEESEQLGQLHDIIERRRAKLKVVTVSHDEEMAS